MTRLQLKFLLLMFRRRLHCPCIADAPHGAKLFQISFLSRQTAMRESRVVALVVPMLPAQVQVGVLGDFTAQSSLVVVPNRE